MTQRQIEAEVARLLVLFDLREWQLDARTDDFEGVNVEGERKVGDLRRWEFALEARLSVATKRDESEVLKTVRHEIAHLLLGEMADVFGDAARQLGLQASKIAEEAWQRAEERTVTRIVRAIGRLKGEKEDLLG